MSNSTCWHCNGELIWQSDIDYEDVYHDGEGIITYLMCSNCDAHIEYTIRFNNEGEVLNDDRDRESNGNERADQENS